ncbi:SH3 and cysteine-rich domain-containing protein 2-like [Triplophysa dalaica]|uniref:SH3 and cysteine-rich domain-containing protein 2-like n=1 Tax=Triplophysa dalaica TaxID=1582913 RepID=UPI0024DF9444|nr:SH3 and cysteine-rich domain-containing protein 2-like [Triplophysa dalaica]
MNIRNGPERELRIHERAADSSGTAQKLLRLKRSLTFMRSKSVENFFQRSQNDAHLSSDIIHSPNDNTATPSISISPTASPAPSVIQQRPPLKHFFLEHVFRRPTSCHLCKNIIVGNSKQGLHCKTCKMGAHLWCVSELSQQACQGKSGMFRRNLSSPSLNNTGLCVVRSQEAQVDPVYTTLRFGSSLARSSFCESPTQSLDEEDEQQMNECLSAEDVTEHSEKDSSQSENEKHEVDEMLKVPKVPSLHTYVVLYKFIPQEQNDLELHPGDRVQVIDDSNEEWWKGKCGERVGFFPANFVQRVRPGERVWKVTQGVHGNRDLGHMTVKEAQICVGKGEDTDGFLKLSSGKKKGLVPADSLEEI